MREKEKTAKMSKKEREGGGKGGGRVNSSVD